MGITSKRAAALLVAGSLAALGGSGAGASEGSLRAWSALAEIDGEGAFLFTTRFCEPGRCLDAIPGVTRTGRSSLPVLVSRPGQQVAFKVGFAPSSLQLTVRARGVEVTTALAEGMWQVPEDLPLPASLQLDARSETHSGTFLATLDRTAPGPLLDRPRIRVRSGRQRTTFDLRFRLCSQQTGAIQVLLTEKRLTGTRRVERVLPTSHGPGCAAYRFEQESTSSLGAPRQLVLRARVGRSELSNSAVLRPATKA